MTSQLIIIFRNTNSVKKPACEVGSPSYFSIRNVLLRNTECITFLSISTSTNC